MDMNRSIKQPLTDGQLSNKKNDVKEEIVKIDASFLKRETQLQNKNDEKVIIFRRAR